jgi:predicted RNase H-like HicB family nuclease
MGKTKGWDQVSQLLHQRASNFPVFSESWSPLGQPVPTAVMEGNEREEIHDGMPGEQPVLKFGILPSTASHLGECQGIGHATQRWIAEALELPGVMTYGQTPEEAIGNTKKLAIDVIADRVFHGELPPSALNVSFLIARGQLAGD